MNSTFEPKHVPSDVIMRWPAMALALWKGAFKRQSLLLLVAALIMKLAPDWAPIIGLLIAPSLFIICFSVAQLCDEYWMFSCRQLLDSALPGTLKLGYVSAQFAACFGLVMAALRYLVLLLLSHPSEQMQEGNFIDEIKMPPIAANEALDASQSLIVQFIHFITTWTEGVTEMMFLGMFIVAIYEGIFGVVLYGQRGMNLSTSRAFSWQAWQINSASIEDAFRNAPLSFYGCLALAILAIISALESVYLSPLGLVIATYLPCLAYVAYRSIFLGKDENVSIKDRKGVEHKPHFMPA
jgi:hypothetical protein